MDQYKVQLAIPSKTNQTKKEAHKQTKTHNHNQNKPNRTQRSGIATSNGNDMHDDILCVIG